MHLNTQNTNVDTWEAKTGLEDHARQYVNGLCVNPVTIMPEQK